MKELSTTSKKDKTYLQLRKELDEALLWFESDDIDIDDAINHYEYALKLAKELETYLLKAENKIKKLTSSY
jgi:exodeoxyribonuclease VII small subunit